MNMPGIKTSGPVIYSEDPVVQKFFAVLTVDQAAHFIALARPMMKAAAVAGYGGEKLTEDRTNQICWLDKHQDDTVLSVCQRISELVDRPLSHAERIQVVHYKVGEEFKPHYDAIRPISIYTQESIKNMGGQRQLTALVYLNQVEAGGETYFPKLNISQAPEFTSMLVFSNVKEGQRLPDPLSLHGAAPVIKGEKWAFNLWFREQETGV